MEQLIVTFVRFWYTMIIVIILARVLYFRHNGNREILFTYILLSAVISLLCILVSRVEISLGFALGIFAIFGIIRYRTTQISPREMTYLFLCSGIAAKNMLAPQDVDGYKLLVSDLSILILAAIAEYFLFRKNNSTKSIVYDNLELIHPEKIELLKEDLKTRFGIVGVYHVSVGRINTIKNFAEITISVQDQ